jgi:ribosome maturation factor RimP
MTGQSHQITRRVQELVEPVLDELGFELVDTRYLSSQGRWILRLYIDREGGVTIDDCVRVSREIGDLIDVKDIIRSEYLLEVSSPGLNRPLGKEKDLERALGKKIKVKTRTPLNGRSNFTGVLKAYQAGNLHMVTENQPVVIPWSDIEKANLVYEFEE